MRKVFSSITEDTPSALMSHNPVPVPFGVLNALFEPSTGALSTVDTSGFFSLASTAESLFQVRVWPQGRPPHSGERGEPLEGWQHVSSIGQAHAYLHSATNLSLTITLAPTPTTAGDAPLLSADLAINTLGATASVSEVVFPRLPCVHLSTTAQIDELIWPGGPKGFGLVVPSPTSGADVRLYQALHRFGQGANTNSYPHSALNYAAWAARNASVGQALYFGVHQSKPVVTNLWVANSTTTTTTTSGEDGGAGGGLELGAALNDTLTAGTVTTYSAVLGVVAAPAALLEATPRSTFAAWREASLVYRSWFESVHGEQRATRLYPPFAPGGYVSLMVMFGPAFYGESQAEADAAWYHGLGWVQGWGQGARFSCCPEWYLPDPGKGAEAAYSAYLARLKRLGVASGGYIHGHMYCFTMALASRVRGQQVSGLPLAVRPPGIKWARANTYLDAYGAQPPPPPTPAGVRALDNQTGQPADWDQFYKYNSTFVSREMYPYTVMTWSRSEAEERSGALSPFGTYVSEWTRRYLDEYGASSAYIDTFGFYPHGVDFNANRTGRLSDGRAPAAMAQFVESLREETRRSEEASLPAILTEGYTDILAAGGAAGLLSSGRWSTFCGAGNERTLCRSDPQVVRTTFPEHSLHEGGCNGNYKPDAMTLATGWGFADAHAADIPVPYPWLLATYWLAEALMPLSRTGGAQYLLDTGVVAADPKLVVRAYGNVANAPAFLWRLYSENATDGEMRHVTLTPPASFDGASLRCDGRQRWHMLSAAGGLWPDYLPSVSGGRRLEAHELTGCRGKIQCTAAISSTNMTAAVISACNFDDVGALAATPTSELSDRQPGGGSASSSLPPSPPSPPSPSSASSPPPSPPSQPSLLVVVEHSLGGVELSEYNVDVLSFSSRPKNLTVSLTDFDTGTQLAPAAQLSVPAFGLAHTRLNLSTAAHEVPTRVVVAVKDERTEHVARRLAPVTIPDPNFTQRPHETGNVNLTGGGFALKVTGERQPFPVGNRWLFLPPKTPATLVVRYQGHPRIVLAEATNGAPIFQSVLPPSPGRGAWATSSPLSITQGHWDWSRLKVYDADAGKAGSPPVLVNKLAVSASAYSVSASHAEDVSVEGK
jgi:hypothetical protein